MIHPLDKSPQHSGILLYYCQDVFIPLKHVMADRARPEISVQVRCCKGNPSHSRLRPSNSLAPTQPALFVKSPLRLLPQTIVNTREHNNEFVAEVRSFGSKSGEVCGLPTLDVPEDKPACLEICGT